MASIFINEIHYDNDGTDIGEAIEIVGPAGTNLAGWQIVLYNGLNGSVYDTDELSGTIPDQANGFGAVSVTYSSNGIQNGTPDGIALVDNTGTVVQFLSYEGTFTAVGGPANGLTSTDIGVAESSSTPVGASLQLTGTGSVYDDFTWSAVTNDSFGDINAGQTFTTASDPEPIDLSNYVRIGRYNLPVPARTNAPAGSQLALEVSTVTYNPDTDTLFILGDEGTSIVQVSKTGQLIDSMTLTVGDFDDPEGLTFVSGNQFVLVEERERQANFFTYVPNSTLSRADVQTVKLGTTVGNIGLEGISYDPQTGEYILVKETSPQGIFQTGIDFATGIATNGSPTTENSTNLFDPALANLTDIADVYALSNLPGPLTDDNLLVLSQEDGVIINVDRTGNITSSLAIASDSDNPLTVAGQGHEGVTMDNNGLLYIVNERGGGDGDHPQLWVYAPTSFVYTNAAPVEVSLSNATPTLAENSDTSAPIQVGTIIISDDALGTNTLSLGGTDAGSFEINGSGLFLKAGIALDFETKPSFEVTVNVDDASVGSTPDVSTTFTLEITDVVDAPTGLIISEVAPWSSGNSPGVGEDWFEVTNTGTTAVDITGWRMDDSSASFASSVALSGVTSIAPDQSVIFIEGDSTKVTAFVNTWFGGTLPTGVQIGTYSGSGVGLSTGSDAVNLFDAGGTLVAGVTFGTSPSASPFATFDNTAGATTVSTLSVEGVNGAFSILDGGVTLIGSPGTIETPATALIKINEVDADTPGSDAAEFVELYDGGAGNTSLDGLVVVFYNGSNDLSYAAFDLDGYSTNADGYFVLGNPGVANVDLTFDPGSAGLLQNGADAVALYQGNAADFPNGTSVTAINLLDAIVYDTSDSDDAELLNGLGQSTQYNENANGNGATESNSRVPNGTGAFVAQAPTPGASNVPSFDLQITEIWPGQAGTDLTADWFEITNVGNAAWVSGVDPNLFYDDESASSTEADLIQGINDIAPGESVIVLVDGPGNGTEVSQFISVWGSVINLTGVEIGYAANSAGLGGDSDVVNLFVGGAAAETIVDAEAYSNAGSFDGQSFVVEAAEYSVAGVNGAVATQTLGGNNSNIPAVGSPGNGAPIVPVDITFIHEIQGSGAASALVGQVVTVEAIVVGDFQNGDADDSRNLGGFYLQEEDGDADADLSTSEGIFVFQSSFAGNVNIGDKVRVTGTVDEFFGETQIDTITSIEIISPGNVMPTAATISLPFASTTLSQNGDVQPDLEAFEGMRVIFPDELTINEMFQLDRFNEIKLVQGDRPFQFTQLNDPDPAAYAAYLQEVGARTITYDDGLNVQNALIGNLDGFGPVFNTANAPRMGDTITGLEGVLSYQWAGNAASGATWRVRAAEDNTNTFVEGEPRPASPAPVGGDLKVVSFNVLNYFTTLSGNTAIGLPPRGANNATEFQRQTDKLVTTILEMDADILGLVELENNFLPGDPGNAIEYLVDQLNAVAGPDTYSWVDPDTQFVGDDAIAVGVIYKTSAVSIAPGTSVRILTDAALPGLGLGGLPAVFDGPSTNRAPLAVTFEENGTGEQFTVVVNHLKSKGSPGTAGAADEDAGDGAGFANQTRLNGAIAIDAWLDTDPTGSGDTDFMLLGDFNAYAQEDPIKFLASQGYVDLAQQFIGPDAYSYVFDGQLGTLDYAFANTSLIAQITGITEWHVNADEADALDYNLDFGRDPSIFDGNVPYRNSDHDPLIVGLNLGSLVPIVNGQPATIYVSENNIIVGNAFGAGNIYAGDLFSNTDARVDSDDVMAGTDGDDNIWAGELGSDTIGAGAGNDVIGYGPGNAWVDAGEGDDLVYATGSNSGTNTIDLGAGNDQFWAPDGSNTIMGEGNNLIGIGIGSDTVNTDVGDDFVYSVNGGGGDDELDLDDGNNTIWVESGDYTITTGSDDDIIGLGSGTDVVNAGDGNNIIYMIDEATAGNKDIVTGMGDDYVATGAGSDIINAGVGNDFVLGGEGSDTFVLNPGDGWLTIGDFIQGEDKLELTGGLTFANIEQSSSFGRTWLWTESDILAELSNFAGTVTATDFSAV